MKRIFQLLSILSAIALPAAAAAFGLTGVRPIGKWTYQTGGYTHWVVEELPPGTVILVK